MASSERDEGRQVDPGRAPRLDGLERWMLDVVSHREGVSGWLAAGEAKLPASAARLEDVVDPSKSLSAAERLGIYANMYYWRLIDVLAEDYPTARHVLGADHFYRCAKGYIDAHPSTHYSLTMLGRAFPEYLCDEAPDVAHREFVVEVAELERSIEIVFDAPRSAVLAVDDLLGVPEDRWAEMSFRVSPSLRLHAFRYPVNEYYQALRDESPMDAPEASRSWLAVFRRHFKVWRMPLTEPQYTLLQGLARGATLGAAVEDTLSVPGLGPEELLGSLRDWFRTWAGEELFVAVESAG